MRNIDKKYHLLYKTTNVLNGKYYYGIHSTNKIDDGYLGSGKYFRHSLRKYGKDNFKREIIKEFDNREELIEAEIDLITEDILRDPYNMNIMYGGEKWNTLGMITVKDKDDKCFNVFNDDERYLSGELVGVTKGTFNVKDKDGKILKIPINDERYLSGELIGICTGYIPIRDSDGNTFSVLKEDPRYLSGELKHVMKDTITVKDKEGKILQVSIKDEKYLSGELISIWNGRTHTDESKKKMSESSKGKNKGNKNGSFGTCWITKDGDNKKIKKELLQSFIDDGWIKGRK